MCRGCHQQVLACVYIGIVRGYYIHHVAVNDLGETLEDTAKVLDLGNSSRSETVVGDLRPETTYEFAMSAYTRRAEGERTKGVRVKTHGAGNAQCYLDWLHSPVAQVCTSHSHLVDISMDFCDRACIAAGPRVCKYLPTDLRQPDLSYTAVSDSRWRRLYLGRSGTKAQCDLTAL